MNKLNKKLIGKNIECGEEWYGGRVYYTDIYEKNGKLFGKHKIYYNTYSKKIERTEKDREVWAFFGYEIVKDCGLLDPQI